jgi:hypothetical protein
MITNLDRSGWFGASDTNIICTSWETKTFQNWWLEKLGIRVNGFHNVYMDTGNIVERQIIDKINELTGRRIRYGKYPKYNFKYRLRVNYDGLWWFPIEVKTTKEMFSKIPIAYWRQCQTLMFSDKADICELWAYELLEDEYSRPYYLDIDPDRLKMFTVERDDEFIRRNCETLLYLKHCLKQRHFPDEKEFGAWKS